MAFLKSKEIFRFCAVGFTLVGVDFGLYRLFFYLGLEIFSAKFLAYVIVIFLGFLANKFWTFESKNIKLAKTEITKYLVLYTLTGLINALINALAIEFLDSVNFAYSVIFAYVISTGISTILNFLGQKIFVFKPKNRG